MASQPVPRTVPARDRLIVGLDLPSVAAAMAMVQKLDNLVGFYQISTPLIFGGGLELASELAQNGKKILIDLKLHETPENISKAVQDIAQLGATFLTVHSYPQTMRSAVQAKQGANPGVLAVTLNSLYDTGDLAESRYPTVEAFIANRADQAVRCGVDGLLCMSSDVAALRAVVGQSGTLVAIAEEPLQANSQAILAGADYLLDEKSIVQSADPVGSVKAIVAGIDAALRERDQK